MSSDSISEIGRVRDRMPALALAVDQAGRLSIGSPEQPVKLSDGRIGTMGRLPLAHPATEPRLIGAATVLILELMPYLALAAELFAPLNGRAASAA